MAEKGVAGDVDRRGQEEGTKDVQRQRSDGMTDAYQRSRLQVGDAGDESMGGSGVSRALHYIKLVSTSSSISPSPLSPNSLDFISPSFPTFNTADSP